MIRLLAVMAVLFATATAAQDAGATDGSTLLDSPVDRWTADPTTVFEASEIDLDDFLWLARPVVVFSDTIANPAFRQQVDLLLERADDLAERDVLLVVDTNPDEPSDLRRKLRPRGFMLTIIGKDGQVELRKPRPWDVREITRTIDKMPLRQQEIRDRR